ncbi:MAG: amino acid ABC transporter permease [Xanthobacteraceae bacterium]
MRPPVVALHRNPRVRSIILQGLFLLAVLWVAYEFIANARNNLAAQNIASGFGFLEQTAGFDVSQSLIPYRATDSYGRLFLVGLSNTLLVSALGILFATAIGFTVGIARLSSNWLVSRLAGAYVEALRNLPLLFQLLFWYLAVLGTLPAARESISIFGEVFLNNRGIVTPRPIFGAGSGLVLAAAAGGFVAAVGLKYWARRRQAAAGESYPVLWPALALIFGLPLAAMIATGFPIEFERPRLAGFNFLGGLRINPEFVALLVALSTYTAAFIAETVRSGILAVPRGQNEAAYALGLRRGLALRLVVVPQALRVIIPPLTSHYLNLTKNSSLAVAIGYPDLFAVFAGTALNQTGQAMEIVALTMTTYLLISLITSAAMNFYNARLRLKER